MIRNVQQLHVSEVKGEGAAKKVDHIIEDNHYLESVNSVITKHRYLITVPLRGVVGAVAWSKPIAREEDQENTLELHRFWTSDVLPKNSESYVLGYMMRDLEQYDYERLISYTSTGQGHKGTIYKATNWSEKNVTRDYTNCSGWETRDGRENRDGSSKIKFEKMM